jgi:hypothetical protein
MPYTHSSYALYTPPLCPAHSYSHSPDVSLMFSRCSVDVTGHTKKSSAYFCISGGFRILPLYYTSTPLGLSPKGPKVQTQRHIGTEYIVYGHGKKRATFRESGFQAALYNNKIVYLYISIVYLYVFANVLISTRVTF